MTTSTTPEVVTPERTNKRHLVPFLFGVIAGVLGMALVVVTISVLGHQGGANPVPPVATLHEVNLKAVANVPLMANWVSSTGASTMKVTDKEWGTRLNGVPSGTTVTFTINANGEYAADEADEIYIAEGTCQVIVDGNVLASQSFTADPQATASATCVATIG